MGFRSALTPQFRRMAVVAATVLISLLTTLTPAGLNAQRLLMEDFVYPPGDSLTPYGWSSSSATNPILTSSDGLQFGRYQGSGVGNAAILKSTGQDVQKEFTPDTSGKLFVWALVNVSSARSGDYFMHLQPSPGSSVYVGRTYARLASNGALTFGVAKRGTNTAPTVVYSDSVYSLGSTYLLVVKYEFNPGSTSDDEISLFVFGGGEIPQIEPANAAVGPVADATADPAVLGALALRQGDQSRAPVLTIDGIRLTRGWDACLPATLGPLEASVEASPPGIGLSWRAWTEIDVAGYHVDRWSRGDERFLPITASIIAAMGASGQPVDYRLVDESAGTGIETYRLRLVTTGGEEYVADSVLLDLPTGVGRGDDHFKSPDPYAGANTLPILQQNYPNPFNPKSLIRFTSPVTQHLLLELHDILGRHQGILYRGLAEGGRVYEIEIDGHLLCTGVYIARLVWSGGATTRRLLVLR